MEALDRAVPVRARVAPTVPAFRAVLPILLAPALRAAVTVRSAPARQVALVPLAVAARRVVAVLAPLAAVAAHVRAEVALDATDKRPIPH